MLNAMLVEPLFGDAWIAELFSESHYVACLLDVEVALARAQASLGVIPAAAADQIARAAAKLPVNLAAIHAGVEQSSIPTIELVKQLRAAVGSDYAAHVHWGATSQDIMDTALILQLRGAIAHLEAIMQLLVNNLANRARAHRYTVMAGRTHAQQAVPITFGLKVAGWLAPLLRQRERLNELKARLLVVQFGGAAGTLASLGDDGLAVQAALARELDLRIPLTTWHTQRDNLAEFAGWLSLTTGSLAKMAQDIILLAQSEIAEVRESDDPARGGSSTMPQKSNPIISETIIAAARANAALLSTMHQAMIQEHERATGGWQMEWLALPQMIQLTAAALTKARFLSEHLVVNVEQMHANVQHTNGLVMAEPLSLSLAPIIGSSRAKQMIKAAVQTTLNEGRHLVDVVREQVNLDLDWAAFKDESRYLGASDALIDRVLREAGRIKV
jgi:3-carboxy-cis,cis-muconate cycloisomerase